MGMVKGWIFIVIIENKMKANPAKLFTHSRSISGFDVSINPDLRQIGDGVHRDALDTDFEMDVGAGG